MRIVLLQSVVALGGYEQHMLNLATGLQRLGHEVHIMGLINAGGFSLLREAAAPDIPVDFPQGWPHDPQHAWKMLDDLKPDVVNAQLPVSQLALERNRAPVVGTVHSEFSFDMVPRCDAAVCLDQRAHKAACTILNVRVHPGYNGIDLERFPYRRDVAERKGIAYWGRFDPLKMAAAEVISATHPVDCWGDTVPLAASGLRVRGRSRPEEVCYNYRIMTGSGLCALEMMACGALLLSPEMTPGNIITWANASFAVEVVYPPTDTTNQAVRHDLAGLLTLGDSELQERADFCRDWIEQEHDCVGMAGKFLDVYESVL